nr:hypothetical protein [Tanacetum cinerariifolium]
MKDYIEQLERLSYVLPRDLSVGLILNGLTSDFAGFVRNYNMHNMGKTIGELHALRIEYEKGLPKKAATTQVMAIQGGRIQKANKKSQKAKGKGKGKGNGKDKSYIPKPKNPKPSAKENRQRMTPATTVKSSSGIFTIELFSFHNKSWVYDTGCGTHICIIKQGLRGARKLEQGALYLYMGNGVRAQVEAIESFDLVLPNGLVICLDNCHYAPTLTRGVVSVSHLVDNGFIQCFTDYGISVSKNDVLYFNAISRNCIYEIDMSNLVPNVNSIYNVSNKRVKQNLDATYPWHRRLAHISKKRIKKLQHDGILKSTDNESFDRCVSCLSGKMTRKSFPHLPERVIDLLGLIHTDVCRPLRHVSRQGASYFITFTDDYIRYGNIYLLKHKHEVFETFKDYALESVARILNMVSTKKVDKIPYELWYGKVPNLFYLKVWGCYYFYFPPENTIVVARYAEFFEKNLLSQEVSGRAGELKEIQDEDTSPSENTSEIPMEVKGFNHLIRKKLLFVDPESNKWLDAMNAKMQSIKDNQVWRLVDLPPNCKTIMSKWLFKKKTDMDGNVHTYKARLVTKGFIQLYGVDYEETFSLFTDIRAIRILIAIAVFYDYEIWQMDVKTTFLNGYLNEDIYMVQPKGFVNPKHPRKVCKLQRSIYGLKQASRNWNKIFDEEIKRFRFTQNLDEPCVYQKASRSNVTFLILYVDDIIIMENHIPSLQSVKTYLGKCFAMKDLGEATFILGIKIYRDRSKRLTRLSQSAYMDKILKRYKMDNSKRGYIPMQERLDLNKTQGEPHWIAVKTILKYLRNTKDMFLVYGGNLEAELRVDCYCDAGFETDRDDTKS